MGRQKWLSGFPELLTDDFSCHAYYMGIDVIRINSVLLAALNLSLRALQGFVDPMFKLMGLSLYCPDDSPVSRWAKRVNISIKTPARGVISHHVIDSSGLKVSGEGEWKVRQHGADRHRVWRRLHLAADSETHEIICAGLSLSGTTDTQALPGLISQTHRKIREASADGAYDTRYCHDGLPGKKSGHLYRHDTERNIGLTDTLSVAMPWQISL